MTPSQRRDFESIAATACSQPLCQSEQARLEALLVEDEEARQLWLDFCRLHIELDLHTRAGVIAAGLRDRVQGADAGAEESSDQTGSPPAAALASPAGGRRTYRISMAAAAVAASLLAAAALIPRGWQETPKSSDRDGRVVAAVETDRTPKRRPEVVAVLRSQPDAKPERVGEEEECVVLAGEELAFGDGPSDVKMVCGANLLVEGPATVRFVSSNHVRLLAGSLSANLPEWARGFIVDTNAMRLIDLGTTFAVTSESATVAEAQVLKGLVKVQPRERAEQSLSGFLLNEGESVRIEGPKAVRNQVNLESSEARRRILELEKLDSYQPIPVNNSGVGLSVGEEDQHWRLVATSAPIAFDTPRYAVVCTPHPRYSINEPRRSQWLSVSPNNERLPADSSYTFRTHLDLTDYDSRSVRLIGQILADNGVRQICLNGDSVGDAPWINNTPNQRFDREEFHVIEISEGFLPGLNTIEIDVWNGGEYKGMPSAGTELQPNSNPMALRVEWQAFGRPSSYD
ncbi:MAG: hypothetical protein AAGJ46_02270 [Planctomycetota bacterium]